MGALNSQVTNNTTNIAQNKTDSNNINQGLANGTIGLVQQDQASGVITVGKNKAGDELNVADGEIEADSKEAINGGQMYQMQAKFDTQISEYFKQGDSGRFNELEASVSNLNDKG